MTTASLTAPSPTSSSPSSATSSRRASTIPKPAGGGRKVVGHAWRSSHRHAWPFGSRTSRWELQGARVFCRIRSYISTIRKRVIGFKRHSELHLQGTRSSYAYRAEWVLEYGNYIEREPFL